MAGLRLGRPVSVLPSWGVIAVAAPWPMGTQPLLVMQAFNDTSKLLFKLHDPHLTIINLQCLGHNIYLALRDTLGSLFKMSSAKYVSSKPKSCAIPGAEVSSENSCISKALLSVTLG